MGRTSLVAAAIVAGVALVRSQAVDPPPLVERFRAVTRESTWTEVARIPMRFPTFHPQGMVRSGDTLFVSSVEVTAPTRRYPRPQNGLDRDAGQGVGHLFKIDLRPDRAGTLLAAVTLGEGASYHPGGIDFDGTSLWVPVAEYRPDSRAIVYKVDPQTLKAAVVLRVDDHIGGVVHDIDDGALHGVSWGSRRFYRWPLNATGTVAAGAAPKPTMRLNPSHYVDYQDCHYAGRRTMLCGGISDLRSGPGTTPLRLGGLDLVDLRDGRPLHQVPVPLSTPGGLAMTRNPMWLEATAAGLRAYFMPEDDASVLYVYDVAKKADDGR